MVFGVMTAEKDKRASPASKPDARKTRRRGPRKVSERYLRNAALYYLQRYASSAANLERVLMRKVTRSAEAHGTSVEEGRTWVATLIAEFQRLGLLNDGAYAEARARTLHRRGASTRLVRARLAETGVGSEDIDHALAALAGELDAPELAAALNYARRRRLGPYRPAAERAAKRERDLAALGRQGFPLDLALRIVDAEDPAALEEEAAGFSEPD